MLDLIDKATAFYPLAALLAGLGGSLHCMGMCGGLVTASCSNNTDIMKYQFGRLAGYMLLGCLAGFIGKTFKITAINPIYTLILGILIGLIFIYWGVQNSMGKKAEFFKFKFVSNLYIKSYSKIINLEFKSFLIGLISILLPCGLLFGILIGAIALQDPIISAISMLLFWLGTLPAMILFPNLFTKLLSPIKKFYPKVFSLSLIAIGIITISLKVNAHFSYIEKVNSGIISAEQELNCHE